MNILNPLWKKQKKNLYTMTPNEMLKEIEEKIGLSPAVLSRKLKISVSEGKKMIEQYRKETEFLEETKRLLSL